MMKGGGIVFIKCIVCGYSLTNNLISDEKDLLKKTQWITNLFLININMI